MWWNKLLLPENLEHKNIVKPKVLKSAVKMYQALFTQTNSYFAQNINMYSRNIHVNMKYIMQSITESHFDIKY